LSIAKNAANQEKSWRKRQFICALLNKTIYYSNARVLVVVVVPILPAPPPAVCLFSKKKNENKKCGKKIGEKCLWDADIPDVCGCLCKMM
jgi:hypothetical protein